jgi:hypothetical protein
MISLGYESWTSLIRALGVSLGHESWLLGMSLTMGIEDTGRHVMGESRGQEIVIFRP